MVILNTTKIESFIPCTIVDVSWKFNQILSINFWVILATNITTLVEVTSRKGIQTWQIMYVQRFQ